MERFGIGEPGKRARLSLSRDKLIPVAIGLRSLPALLTGPRLKRTAVFGPGARITKTSSAMVPARTNLNRFRSAPTWIGKPCAVIGAPLSPCEPMARFGPGDRFGHGHRLA